MARSIKFSFVILLFARITLAQEPVNKWQDVTSYATASINPIWGTIDAIHSNDKKCKLTQLAISEGIGNTTALLMKHFITSPRPCINCRPDGMPSGHTLNSFIGASSHLSFGIGFTVATGILRKEANRHTWPQIISGAGVGIASEYVSHLLKCSS